MSLNDEVKTLITSLQTNGIIPINDYDITKMKGTTDGVVYIIQDRNQPKYVLKLDHPQQNSFAFQFLDTYSNIRVLPKLLEVAPDYQYILYTYLNGTTHFNRGSKKEWLTLLVKELFNHYQRSDSNSNWGRFDIPRTSWHEFNLHSIEWARESVASILPNEDYATVRTLVDELSAFETKEDKFLLHGDTGVHNFTFLDQKLTGVIDPSPMIGPVIYDFTYAFCSSPDDLNRETLLDTFSHLNLVSMDQTRLIKEVIVQLYTRIGICARVHPQDLADYVVAWDYWKKQL
ncbi:phosphotransferase [Sutcliffiella halmapala]|uniref:phosphotransferase n=1 Tax=Sutcliffiella halmapala TaxID=79882 RepID=UPI0009959896|nr:phosphotransferase [Sutcliffiella halmapala]